jgi:hypothetical protein
MKPLVLPLLLVPLLSLAPALRAVTIGYYNDFSDTGDSTAFPTETSNAQWTVVGGAYQNSVTGTATTVASSASIPVTGIADGTFILETRFTVSALGTTVSNGVQSIGFGLFGGNNAFTGSTTANAYYLADLVLDSSSAASPEGQLRLLSSGDSGGFTSSLSTVADPAATDYAIVLGTTYTLRLTGVYTSGTLNLSLGLFNAAGTTQFGLSSTASDTSPLTGTNFGYRNRFATTTGTTSTVNFDNFSLVPEPSGALLALGSWAFFLAGARRRALAPG